MEAERIEFRPSRLVRWFYPPFELRPADVVLVVARVKSVRFDLAESIGGGAIHFKPLARRPSRETLVRDLTAAGFRVHRDLKPVKRRVAEPYPNLGQVLGCYLHQDFDLEYASPDDALRDAARSQGHDQVSAAVREIDELLDSGLDAKGLEEAVHRLTGWGYGPELDGWKVRDWLLHAKEVLSAECRRWS